MSYNPYAILGLAEDGRVGRGLVRSLRPESNASTAPRRNNHANANGTSSSRRGPTGNTGATTNSRAPLREAPARSGAPRSTVTRPSTVQGRQNVAPQPSKPVEEPVKTESEKRQEFFAKLKSEAMEAQKKKEQVFSKSKKSETLSRKVYDQSSATKRLLRDLKQLEREPMKTISAAPVKDNLFNWHCNLRPNSGPYAGVTFHLALTFPQNYPHEPPSLLLYTPIPHPNIYGSWICLNMLRPSSSGSYSGWSSAYTVQSILLQLQTFMMAENIPQDYGDDKKQVNDVKTVDRTKQQIDSYKCSECGHSYSTPNPPLPPAELDQTSGGQRIPESTMSSMLTDPENLLDIHQSSDNLWLDPSKLICGSDQTEGWFGVRSYNGYVFGGDLKQTVYYEVYVAGTGVSRVGFSLYGSSFNLGTDWRGWGYGGTGKKSNCGNFTDYGEGYRKGDIIGCALDLVTGNVVFFKNGQCQGLAFTIPEQYRGRRFYPTVAVRNMFFMVNFGAHGFAFNPKEFKKEGAAHSNFQQKQKSRFFSSRSKFTEPAEPAKPQLPSFTEVEFPQLASSNQSPKYITSFNTTVWSNIHVNPSKPAEQVEAPKKKEVSKTKKSSPAPAPAPVPSPVPAPVPAPSLTNPFTKLPPELISYILNFLDDFALHRAATTHPIFLRTIRRYFLLEKRELVCFHSKKSYEEDVLGFGLYIDPQHQKVKMSGDIVSYNAFYSDKVKKGVWGEEINTFLPLVINSTYKEKRKILPLLRKCLQPKNEKNWKPAHALNVLPSLMSSIITNFLQSAMNTRISPYVCEKALEGYLNIHYMLLSLDQEEPILSAMVDKMALLLQDSPKNVPVSLPEFICSLSISSSNLEDIQQQLVNEFWARNVQDYYGLWMDVPQDKEEGAIRNTFKTMKEKIFIFLAHLEFLRWFAKSKPKEKMLQFYDRSFGRVNETMTAQLVRCCNSILDVVDVIDRGTGIECMEVFYAALGLPSPSVLEFTSSIENNRKTRYWSKS